MQQFFRKKNGGLRERPVLPLILIRICSRDPGQHMLVKQPLEGVGTDPFAFSGVGAMVATRLSVVMVCFFSFGPHLQQSSNLLGLLAAFLL